MAVKRYNGTAWVTEAGGINSTLLQTKAATGLNVVIPSGATNGTVGVNGAVTIGSAVSSITVSGAFTSTYDNYKIVVNGGTGSTAGNLSLKLGASTTGYFAGLNYVTYTVGTSLGAADNNAAAFSFGGVFDTTSSRVNCDLLGPFLAKNTGFSAAYLGDGGGGFCNGVHKVATSYTDFTLTTSSGTLTGGTIRVYGYNNG